MNVISSHGGKLIIFFVLQMEWCELPNGSFTLIFTFRLLTL